jgi:thiamine-phosphate pyrophosphorylase
MEKIPYSKILAITNRHLCRNDFLEQITKVCRLHPQAIILREKDLSKEEYQALAKKVLEITKSHQVECRLHFYWETALDLKEDAIHLPLWRLKEMTPERKAEFRLIGTSIHSLEEAKEAVALGADYLTAGHIYQTDCKKGVPPRGLSFLREVCREIEVSVYAIGGIGLCKAQIEEVMAAGAKGACIMSGMMQV